MCLIKIGVFSLCVLAQNVPVLWQMRATTVTAHMRAALHVSAKKKKKWLIQMMICISGNKQVKQMSSEPPLQHQNSLQITAHAP